MSHRIRVAVLRGGPSVEHEVSLNSGENILSVLQHELAHKYHPHDIVIDKHGQWFRDGKHIGIGDVARSSDVVWNALHGTFGEDGQIQQLLESHRIPFTGSDSMSSSVGMNKRLSKKVFIDHDIPTPHYWLVHAHTVHEKPVELNRELFRTIILPVIVKPVSGGSSVGMNIVTSYTQLLPALMEAAQHDDEILIEEFVKGVEATCGVVDGFRGEELYALPPIEIRPSNAFFDYEAKYTSGKTHKIIPASFPHELKEQIQALAKKIHQVMGLRHYSRSDFMIHPRRGIFVLEVNTLPGFANESLMPKSLRAIGSDTHEFVDHVLELALNK